MGLHCLQKYPYRGSQPIRAIFPEFSIKWSFKRHDRARVVGGGGVQKKSSENDQSTGHLEVVGFFFGFFFVFFGGGGGISMQNKQ